MTALDIYGYSERDSLARYEAINRPSRAAIEKMLAEHGTAWVYRINPYQQETVTGYTSSDEIRNWAGDYVSPCLDEFFVKLLADRLAAPYEGTTKDAERLRIIDDYAMSHQMKRLYWE